MANFTTSFAGTENPLSESGQWINGGDVGLDWTNIRKTPGLAFSTQVGDGPLYSDSIAILAGTWSARQTVTAVVHTVNQQTGSVYEELEILLRFAISANFARGYECLFSCRQAGSAYMQVVRWNGPYGDFTVLDDLSGVALNDGDTVKATIEGSVITTYLNGVQMIQVSDATWASGAPGIGEYLHGALALNADFGFTSFTVTDEYPSFATVKTIDTAVEVVGGAGAPNGGIAIDTWHMSKLGIAPDELRRIPSQYLSWIELSDGQFENMDDPIDEVVNHRHLPGEGEFDLPAYIAVCQDCGYPGPWGVEVLSEELRNNPLDVILRRAYETTASQFCNERSST